MESIAFDNTGKAAAFGRTDNINAVTNIEHVDRNFLTEIVFLGIINDKFSQISEALLSAFIKMTLSSLKSNAIEKRKFVVIAARDGGRRFD